MEDDGLPVDSVCGEFLVTDCEGDGLWFRGGRVCCAVDVVGDSACHGSPIVFRIGLTSEGSRGG